MNWVGKEMLVASLLGCSTGVVVMWPLLRDGIWGALWLAFAFGAPVGLLVGFTAVAGGKYAQRLDLWWPARSTRRWRYRFAGCSAAAVLLVLSGAVGWALASSSATAGPISWIVLAVPVMVSYLCSYLLAPAQPRESFTPGAEATAPDTPYTTAVASGSATHNETDTSSAGTGEIFQKPAPVNVADPSCGEDGSG